MPEAETARHDHDPRTCDGCLMLTTVRRAERAEATLRAWGIEPNAEVDERFRRDLAEINRAEGRSVIGTDRTLSTPPASTCEFEASDPDEDDAPADTCRQCGRLQGEHRFPPGSKGGA